jgi:prepilin-type N-terminal cleavage/methylation domain-containing protein
MVEPLTKPPMRCRTLCPPSSARHAARHLQSGFTLVELLVGVVLGSLVLGALGGVVLVSQMRVSASIRRDLASKDALNRAVALIRSDIGAGSQVQVTTPTHIFCPRGLYITRPGYRYLCYRSFSTASFAASSYSGASDRPWTGGCLLSRDGPMYKTAGTDAGELDATAVATQVILDDLQIVNGSCLGAFSISASGGTTAGRDVDVTIRQTIDPANPTRITTFSARSVYNPLYMRGDYAQGDTSRLTGVCVSGVRHIAFPPSSTAFDQTCRNFYYFPNAFSTYTIQTGCSYATCTVNGTALPYADLLVFADREIRP